MNSASQGAESITLLQTKLHRPRVRDDLVPRPRLLERLIQGLDVSSQNVGANLVVALLGRHKALSLPRIIEKIRIRLSISRLQDLTTFYV